MNEEDKITLVETLVEATDEGDKTTLVDTFAEAMDEGGTTMFVETLVWAGDVTFMELLDIFTTGSSLLSLSEDPKVSM